MRRRHVGFAEKPRDVNILDENGKPLTAGDNERRFFEASWMHKYNGKYYFSYSTGDTHFIVYATGDSPYGPFTYRGGILEPVLGWTNHHSIVEFEGKWYLFYHDAQLSSGQTHLRNVKVDRAEVPRRRHDRDDRRVSRLGHGAPTSPIGQPRIARIRSVTDGADGHGSKGILRARFLLPVRFPRRPRNPRRQSPVARISSVDGRARMGRRIRRGSGETRSRCAVQSPIGQSA